MVWREGTWHASMRDSPQNNFPNSSRSYEIVKVKCSKVLSPVAESRPEASKMWLLQFPRYILPRRYRPPMNFSPIWLRQMCCHRAPDKDPELVKVYFKEDDWTDANENPGSQSSFFRWGFNWSLLDSLDLLRTPLSTPSEFFIPHQAVEDPEILSRSAATSYAPR